MVYNNLDMLIRYDVYLSRTCKFHQHIMKVLFFYYFELDRHWLMGTSLQVSPIKLSLLVTYEKSYRDRLSLFNCSFQSQINGSTET